MATLDLILRLVLAAGAGMALGLERQRGGHPAGVRTHLLVSVGACLFTVGGAYGFPDLERGNSWDPARIAAQVASGIGFIGAGAILRDGATPRGITTAATLWISGATGVCIGAGLFVPSLVAAALVIVALLALGFINGWLGRRQRPTLEVTMTYDGSEGPQWLWSTIAEVEAQLGTVTQLQQDGPQRWELRVILEQVRDVKRLSSRLCDVTAVPGVRNVSVRATE